MITYEELVKAGQYQVRNNTDLMNAYVRIFKERFGYEPNCVSCSFSNDWQKFISSNNTSKPILIMEKSFKLRDELKIYTYKEILENGATIPVRTYGYLMTEEFAKNYLTHGTPEQLKERQTEFKILPSLTPAEEEEVDLTKLKINELKDLATKKGFPKEDWEKLKKEELVIYLETNLEVNKEDSNNKSDENIDTSKSLTPAEEEEVK